MVHPLALVVRGAALIGAAQVMADVGGLGRADTGVSFDRAIRSDRSKAQHKQVFDRIDVALHEVFAKDVLA